MQLAQRILGRCFSLGFARAGIAAARPSGREASFRAWLAAEKHGEMEYLSRNVEVRLDPRRLVEGAASIICVADRHGDDQAPDRPGPWRGRIARYARGDDYHRVIKRRLHQLADELTAEFPEHVFRGCVDTAPLLEREHAERAGLGAVGKNTLLIDRGIGSYMLLGAVATTLIIPPTDPSPPDPCGSCTACIDACPTGAIEPWSVDATACISYLTIEHRGVIDQRYHAAVGDWIFGCDICQEVCPHNQDTRRTRAASAHPAYQPRHRTLDLLAVLNWTEADRREAFQGSAMKRAKLAMMQRNAIIAAANGLASGDHPAIAARITELANDPHTDPIVQHTAEVALTRLRWRDEGASDS